MEPDVTQLLPQLSWHVRDRLSRLGVVGWIRHLGHTAIRAMFYSVRCSAKGSELLMFQSLRRSDYDELFQNVLESMGEQAEGVVLDAQAVWNNRPEAFQFAGLRRSVATLLGLPVLAFRYRNLMVSTWCEYGGFHGSWLLLQLLKIRSGLKDLLASGCRGVVVFAEMQDMDRVLTWLCKRHELPCATLQHGVYAEYVNSETVNVYNYQPPFVSHFLAWGEVTRELVTRYVPSVQAVVCGKPTLKETIPSLEGTPDYACVVILDQNLFEKENQEMLEMVRAVFGPEGGKIGVRFHPQNQPSSYCLEGVVTTDDADWMSTECFVGHTTTFLLDLVMAERVLYRYESGAESVFRDPAIEFRTEEELRNCREKSRSGSRDTVNTYIASMGQESLDAHSAALKDMLLKGRGE